MDETSSLKASFSFDHADLEKAIDQGRDQIEAAADGGLAKLSWPLLRSKLADAIAKQLDSKGLEWFCGAWKFARALHGYKDKDKYPPEVQSFLKLGEHEIGATLEPSFSIRCEGAEVAKVIFETDVTAAFNAVTLAIRDGHITGFGGGDCALSVQLKCGGQKIGDKLTLKEFTLPGEHSFEAPGIAIP